MMKSNPHVGSTFESWLDEQDIREEVTAAAIKEVIAVQLADEMNKKGISKVRMAEMMETSPEKQQRDARNAHTRGESPWASIAPRIGVTCASVRRTLGRV